MRTKSIDRRKIRIKTIFFRFETNINFFLEEYGIMVNTDGVVRTNYHKYFHPKGKIKNYP